MLNDLNQQVCFNFYTGWRAITSIYKDIFGNDITPQNIYTIELCELDKMITMSELSKGLDLNTSAVSTLVSRMEKNGFVIRTFGTKDRRTVFVQLTKKGYELREQVRGKMDLLCQTITENLAPADIDKLVEIVTTIRKNSRKKDRDGE